MINLRSLRIACATLSFASLAACSSMSVRPLAAEPTPTSTSMAAAPVQVSWLADTATHLSEDDRTVLTALMYDELSALAESKGPDWRVSATIRRIETVQPWINWASTLLVVVPVDRGGIAVDFTVQADRSSTIQRVQFAEWTPITELSAQFSRLGPAKAGVHRAVEHLRRTIADQTVPATASLAYDAP